jgi:hypothetical protein
LDDANGLLLVRRRGQSAERQRGWRADAEKP